jgi:DNA-binding transcriptional MocR family regulator
MNKQDQIIYAISCLIKRGVVRPGEKVPSIREMAARYNMSVTPVGEAFRQLEDMEILSARQGAGYYVCDGVMSLPEFSDVKGIREKLSADRFSLLDEEYNNYASIMIDPMSECPMRFNTTSTSSLLFNEKALYRYMSRVVRAFEFDVNYQSAPKDYPAFVREILKWMEPADCQVYAEELTLANSTMHAVEIAVASTVGECDTVAVEAPGFLGFYNLLHYRRLNALHVPSNPVTGIDIDAFEAMLRDGMKVGCLLISANFSNPTGSVMPTENKVRLTELCARYGVPIVEDDVQGDLYFGGRRPLPLKHYDPDNVVYVGGFTKSLSPSLRAGWLAAGKYRSVVEKNKYLQTAFLPLLIQHGFTEYLKSGEAANDVATLRWKLKKLAALYRQRIVDSFPEGTEVRLPGGGPNLWVGLPEGKCATRLVESARCAGIGIAPGSMFHEREEAISHFRFNYASMPWSAETEKAVMKLGNLAKKI